MRTVGNFVCFFGSEDPLSNWHPCQFSMGTPPVSFNCAEQAMMYAKAKLFGDEEISRQIAAAQTPKEQKRLGRLVRNFDEATWVKRRSSIMASILLAKFTQNDSLAAALLATTDKSLVEASPYDKIWGAGIGANDPRITDPSRWPGENLLGQALEQTRASLAQDAHRESSVEDAAESLGFRYGIAQTVEDGENSHFCSGPFDEFPYEEHEAGAIIFMTGGGRPVRVTAPVPTMNDLVGHDFDTLMRETLDRYEVFGAIEAAMSAPRITSREQLGQVICAVDELMRDYAHDMRHDGQHDAVAAEVGGWASLRQTLWNQLALTLPLSNKPAAVVPAVAPQINEPAESGLIETSTRFNFSRPKVK